MGSTAEETREVLDVADQWVEKTAAKIWDSPGEL